MRANTTFHEGPRVGSGMQIRVSWPREDMRAPHLDILRRQSDGGFVWIEVASDVQVAEERIAKLAIRTRRVLRV